METVTTNIHVTPQANRILTDLSNHLNKPKAEVIEQALLDLEERLFWEEVHAAYAVEEADDMKRERELRDTTVADGFEPNHSKFSL